MKYLCWNIVSGPYLHINSKDMWPGKGEPEIDAAGWRQGGHRAMRGGEFEEHLLPRSAYFWKKPKVIVDYTLAASSYNVVSQRFRELIERHQPDGLKFFDYKIFKSKTGDLYDIPYYIMNFLDEADAIDFEQSKDVIRDYSIPEYSQMKISLTKEKSTIAVHAAMVEGRGIWVDRFVSNRQGLFVSDGLFEDMKRIGIRGLSECAICKEV